MRHCLERLYIGVAHCSGYRGFCGVSVAAGHVGRCSAAAAGHPLSRRHRERRKDVRSLKAAAEFRRNFCRNFVGVVRRVFSLFVVLGRACELQRVRQVADVPRNVHTLANLRLHLVFRQFPVAAAEREILVALAGFCVPHIVVGSYCLTVHVRSSFVSVEVDDDFITCCLKGCSCNAQTVIAELIARSSVPQDLAELRRRVCASVAVGVVVEHNFFRVVVLSRNHEGQISAERVGKFEVHHNVFTVIDWSNVVRGVIVFLFGEGDNVDLVAAVELVAFAGHEG